MGYNIETGYRWITVQELQGLLQQLQADDILYPNPIGNLSIIRDDTYIGFLDIAFPALELFARSPEDPAEPQSAPT